MHASALLLLFLAAGRLNIADLDVVPSKFAGYLHFGTRILLKPGVVLVSDLIHLVLADEDVLCAILDAGERAIAIGDLCAAVLFHLLVRSPTHAVADLARPGTGLCRGQKEGQSYCESSKFHVQ